MTRLLLATLLVSACLTAAPEPSCRGTCDGTLRVPQQSDVTASMERARDTLRAQVESGQITLPWQINWEQYPAVTWQACPFYVDDPDCSQTGSGCDEHCAHGKTYDGGTKIMVSTYLSPLGTLEHETRNSFLVRGGRADLAY
jgi:hypothetical protein